MDRICPLLLAGRLKDPSEIHMFYCTIQVSKYGSFDAVSYYFTQFHS